MSVANRLKALSGSQTVDVRMPDGTVMSGVPANAKKADIERAWRKAQAKGAVPDAREKSFWQGAATQLGKGAANYQWLMDTLQGKGIAKAITGQPMPSDITRSQVQQQARNSPYQGSTAGNIVGGVAATLPTMFLPGGGLAQGAAAGGLLTDDPNNVGGMARDVGVGGVAGKAGEMAGKYVLAPVAERIGRTAPARAVSRLVTNAIGRKQLPNPTITKPERIISRAAPDFAPIRQNVDDAARLGLPYSLADSSPELRSLAGSVSRKSGEANAMAENIFAPRARAQADRAAQAVDDLLAPIVPDVARRQDILLKLGSRAAKPHYEAAYARASPIDDTTAAMLRTPAGKQALRQAYDIAANEGRDPLALGFDLDAQGDVVLKNAPSIETLDLVKRGIDTRLNDFKNPVTGKLELKGNGLAKSIEGLRKRFVSHLDTMNSDYSAARGAYQPFARRAESLTRGQKLAAPNVKTRDLGAALGRADPGELRRGYTTGLVDQIEGARLSGNPYERIYGTPRQQDKIGALFPDGSTDFNKQYQLESDMAKTAWETLGGSPTQRRAMADQLFDTNMADYGKSALEAAVNPKMAAMKMVGQRVKDQLATRGENTAASLAPRLFDTKNPSSILDFLDEIAKKQAEEELRKRAYTKSFGLLALPAAAGSQ